jgi:hypothetical protein
MDGHIKKAYTVETIPVPALRARPGGLLRNFQGVPVSNLCAGHDSIDCAQQKCLIHLSRDPNKISASSRSTKKSSN